MPTMSIEESSAPSRRTSCSRCWLASVGRNSGVIVYLPSDSSEQRFETSSIVPPGWIATKKVRSRGPELSELPPQATRAVAASAAAATQIKDRAAQLDFNTPLLG